MCGIAGIFHVDGRPADAGAVAEMVAALAHRGPDAAGTFTDRCVALGHARLSIIDVEGGAQPMRAGDLSITFNGEIFNYVELRQELTARGYRFNTRSDTEVILHAYDAWGERCVDRFNGQWAFAIWNARTQELFLSRDRLGVRPLFYTTVNGSLRFASEVKALFTDPAVPRALDRRGLAQIFTFWVPVPPRTAFEHVQQLPPGHSMRVKADGSIAVRRYWDVDFTATTDTPRTADDYACELRALLRDATALRLRADVPVATYLSGGLDSSITCALVKEIAGDADAFSVDFDDPEFDETSFQHAVADHLGARPHTVRCAAEDIARVFPSVIWHTETPLVRTAPAPLFVLSELVRRSGYKVVMTGEGADEAFGGYDIFKEAKVREFWARQPGSRLRPLLLRRLYPYMPALQRQSDAALRGFFHVSHGAPAADAFFSHTPRWSMTSALHLLFSGDTRDELRDYNAIDDLRAMLPDGFAQWSTLARAQYLEAKLLLPGYILSSQGDRVAMANGVEIRMPFLDYRVFEFAARLPERLRINGLNEKHLVKKAMGAHLPASVVARPKQPYRSPDGKAFMTPAAADYVSRVLSSTAVRNTGIFDPAAVASLEAKFRAEKAVGLKDNMALVGVLSTQLLVEQFVEGPVQRAAGQEEGVAIAR